MHLPQDYYSSIRQGRRLPRYCLGSDSWAGRGGGGREKEGGERVKASRRGRERGEGKRGRDPGLLTSC